MISDRHPVRVLGVSDVRRIAVGAEVDPRTVERALAGRPIRPLSLARVKRALAAAGMSDLLREDEIVLSHHEVRIAAAEARVARRVRAVLAEVAPSPLAARIAKEDRK